MTQPKPLTRKQADQIALLRLEIESLKLEVADVLSDDYGEQVLNGLADITGRSAGHGVRLDGIFRLLTERCDRQDTQIDTLIQLQRKFLERVDTLAQNVLERSIRRDVKTPTLREADTFIAEPLKALS